MSSSQHTSEKNSQLTANGPVIKKKKLSNNDSVPIPEVQSLDITVAGTLTLPNVKIGTTAEITTETDSTGEELNKDMVSL